MKDAPAKPTARRLSPLPDGAARKAKAAAPEGPAVAPLERALELARANASDLWAARRGYTAWSLEPVVARAYEHAGHSGHRRITLRSARDSICRTRDPRADHLEYESIGGAALALQDFLFANQNRLAMGRVLEGTAATRPLPVWRRHGETAEQGSSRRVDVDVDVGRTLHVRRGPVPL